MPQVRTPDILWEATTRRVLTMSWIEGVKLTDKRRMDAAGLDIVDFVNVRQLCMMRGVWRSCVPRSAALVQGSAIVYGLASCSHSCATGQLNELMCELCPGFATRWAYSVHCGSCSSMASFMQTPTQVRRACPLHKVSLAREAIGSVCTMACIDQVAC